MDRQKFIDGMSSTVEVLSHDEMRLKIQKRCKGIDKDLPICMGELAELELELTRFLRGKMNPMDFLQELAHVQWAVWSLQVMFGVPDENVRKAIQISFRD